MPPLDISQLIAAKHRKRYSCCQVTHWNANSACTEAEEYTHRRIETVPPVSHALDFPNTEEGNARFQFTMWMLEDAFAAGVKEQQFRVKDALGIKGPRT